VGARAKTAMAQLWEREAFKSNLPAQFLFVGA
jgi:hypothetical protein